MWAARSVGVSRCASTISHAEETELSLSSDLTFMGKLGEMGQPLIRKKAESTMEEFARNLVAEAGQG